MGASVKELLFELIQQNIPDEDIKGALVESGIEESAVEEAEFEIQQDAMRQMQQQMQAPNAQQGGAMVNQSFDSAMANSNAPDRADPMRRSAPSETFPSSRQQSKESPPPAPSQNQQNPATKSLQPSHTCFSQPACL